MTVRRYTLLYLTLDMTVRPIVWFTVSDLRVDSNSFVMYICFSLLWIVDLWSGAHRVGLGLFQAVLHHFFYQFVLFCARCLRFLCFLNCKAWEQRHPLSIFYGDF